MGNFKNTKILTNPKLLNNLLCSIHLDDVTAAPKRPPHISFM